MPKYFAASIEAYLSASSQLPSIENIFSTSTEPSEQEQGKESEDDNCIRLVEAVICDSNGYRTFFLGPWECIPFFLSEIRISCLSEHATTPIKHKALGDCLQRLDLTVDLCAGRSPKLYADVVRIDVFVAGKLVLWRLVECTGATKQDDRTSTIPKFQLLSKTVDWVKGSLCKSGSNHPRTLNDQWCSASKALKSIVATRAVKKHGRTPSIADYMGSLADMCIPASLAQSAHSTRDHAPVIVDIVVSNIRTANFALPRLNTKSDAILSRQYFPTGGIKRSRDARTGLTGNSAHQTTMPPPKTPARQLVPNPNNSTNEQRTGIQDQTICGRVDSITGPPKGRINSLTSISGQPLDDKTGPQIPAQSHPGTPTEQTAPTSGLFKSTFVSPTKRHHEDTQTEGKDSPTPRKRQKQEGTSQTTRSDDLSEEIGGADESPSSLGNIDRTMNNIPTMMRANSQPEQSAPLHTTTNTKPELDHSSMQTPSVVVWTTPATAMSNRGRRSRQPTPRQSSFRQLLPKPSAPEISASTGQRKDVREGKNTAKDMFRQIAENAARQVSMIDDTGNESAELLGATPQAGRRCTSARRQQQTPVDKSKMETTKKDELHRDLTSTPKPSKIPQPRKVRPKAESTATAANLAKRKRTETHVRHEQDEVICGFRFLII